MGLTFEPLYFGDQLTVINPRGTIGLVTLWSRTDYVVRRLLKAGIDLSPERSPFAVIGTLYGNGFREMLRNLLYNPQIDTLIIFGRNRSGSMEELIYFFSQGLEPHPTEHAVYEATPGGDLPTAMRIKGTSRIIDSLVTPDLFERPPSIVPVGSPQEADAIHRLQEFIRHYHPHPGNASKRRDIPLPRVSITCFPSNPRAHTIVSDDPLSAWQELIFRLHRFGYPVHLAKGERRELQNVKVIVEHPHERLVPPEKLRSHGLDPEHLSRYQDEILNANIQPDETYTYGNRLRAYFGIDGLTAAIERLKADPEDRKTYVTLWDPRRDLTAAKGHPCLVSIFFRRFQRKLTLTATFRTHNALDAWLINFYGLIAIQQYVANECGLSPGAVTVFSHSISLDSRQLDRAALIAGKAHSHHGYREDPMGYFRITVDEDAILVEHRYGDITLKEYRHSKASKLQAEIYRDHALSDLNHAIYLGRQLARAEMCLKFGKPFIQE